MRKILVVGATSAIAEATARVWAKRGEQLFLVARNAERLEAIAADLRVRGAARVASFALDANDHARHAAMLDEATRALDGLDTVLVAHGTLCDQAACEASVALTLQEIGTNALSTVALLTEVANRFAAQGRGTIVVISSVAGDRGRQSNYVYGSAKAMVTSFTSGMRQRLAKKGVTVVTVKPGFVDTPMTAAFRKGVLWAKPAAIADRIAQATDRGSAVVYTPWFWRPIMALIRAVPEAVFRKLSL